MASITTTETENYQYLLGLPIVSDLLRENKKLRKRNKELKRLIRLIGNNMSLLTPAAKREKSPRAEVEIDVSDGDEDEVRIVEIKKEKVVVDVTEEDEPNIAYEIVEEEAENEGVLEEARGDESPAEDPAEDEEVYEVTINGKSYYTTNETSGAIYGLDENGDVSLEVGVYKACKPTFF